MPTATLVQHKHCAYCGKAVLPSRETCDGDCEQGWARVKRNRKWLFRLYLTATVVTVLVAVSFAKVI